MVILILVVKHITYFICLSPNDVKTIIEKHLAKAGRRNDVKFEVNGFGEDENKSPLKIRKLEGFFIIIKRDTLFLLQGNTTVTGRINFYK
jgi:hypothetical protein